jgi:hypothetical protein
VTDVHCDTAVIKLVYARLQRVSSQSGERPKVKVEIKDDASSRRSNIMTSNPTGDQLAVLA